VGGRFHFDETEDAMTAIDIPVPHRAWILIGDGRKALVLRNDGDAVYPNLKTVEVLDQGRVPTTADLGTDKPGRAVNARDGRRSGMEQTDWHDLAEQRFAGEVAQALETHHAAGAFGALVVVAPPRTLAELRRSFSSGLQAKVIAEVDKDLTKHPVHEIERLLFAHDGARH
jgi:protein required for attachment to host cells